MKTQTNLVRRGAVYYFRARFPADLVAHYGRQEILSSLRTKDKQEAICKARHERLRLDQEFLEVRGSQAAGIALALPFSKSARLLVNTAPASPHGVLPFPQNKSNDTLLALFNYWKTQGEKRPRTLLEAESAVTRLSEQTQNKAASELTKSDLVLFKDRLLVEGKAHATVAKQLNLLKAILQTATDNDKLPSNPAAKVKLPKQKSGPKSRVPFSIDDLRIIFSSAIYTAGKRPRAGAGEAAFWMPLLALWTGARLEELGQLLVSDVQEEVEMPYLYISSEDGDKSIKTASSLRKVPIHHELIRYGFLEYVMRMRSAGQIRLFPLVNSALGRQKTASFSQWFGRHLRNTLNIRDSRKVFHSFRHGFKDACRMSGISSEHHDRLTGHAKEGVGDSYGDEYYPLRPLYSSMSKLSYTGLDLSHLYKAGMQESALC